MKKLLRFLLIAVAASSLLLLGLTSCAEEACVHEWQDATCTQPKLCKLCGVADGEALGHELKLDATTLPTCTEDGKITLKCDCGYSETETLSAQGHDLSEHAAKVPSCVEIGWEAYVTCSRCDHTTYKELPATVEHNYVSVVTEPGCTNGGYTTHICGCGESYVDSETQPLDHEIVTHKAENPTCAKVGWEAYETCSRCDYSTYEEIPMEDHDYKHEKIEETCTQSGMDMYICKDCGASKVENFSEFKGHKLVQCEGQEPACIDGYEPYEYCEKCDYTTKKIIPATGIHKYEDIVTPPHARQRATRHTSVSIATIPTLTPTLILRVTHGARGLYLTLSPRQMTA